MPGAFSMLSVIIKARFQGTGSTYLIQQQMYKANGASVSESRK